MIINIGRWVMLKKAKNPKHNKLSGIEIIYTTFIAILIALFFGLGISAFYNEPQAPNFDETIYQTNQNSEKTKPGDSYQKDYENYQKDLAIYNRNVSIIALALSVVALSIALIFISNISIISNGVLLGGIFTLIYSIIKGFSTDNIQYRFIIVTLGLIIALILGYIKFIKPSQTAQKNS